MNALNRDTNQIVVDAETGEILESLGQNRAFEVNDESTALWLLEKLQGLEAEILGLEAKRDAIVANVEAEIRRKRSNIDGLTYRFKPGLDMVARSQLGKSKSWVTPFGAVKYRTVPASYKAEYTPDDPQFVDWAKDKCPESVKTTEKVLVSMIPLDLKAKSGLFSYKEEHEEMTISTGVKK